MKAKNLDNLSMIAPHGQQVWVAEGFWDVRKQIRDTMFRGGGGRGARMGFKNLSPELYSPVCTKSLVTRLDMLILNPFVDTQACRNSISAQHE